MWRCFNMLSRSGSIKCQRRRQMVGKQDIGNLQEGEDLYEALGDDPAYLEVTCNYLQIFKYASLVTISNKLAYICVLGSFK